MACARNAFLFPLILACLGCSPSIKVTHLSPDTQVVSGNPWNLPMTQFTVTVTRHITECGTHIKGNVEIVATSAAVVDDQQRYVLESGGIWSTSDITSNLAPSGVSTGLNAQSTSAAGAIISNLVTAIGKVAVGIAALAQVAPDAKPACAKNVLTAVNQLYPSEGKSLKEQVDDDTAALAAETAKVEVLVAQASADDAYKAKIPAALQAQAAAKQKLLDDQKKLADNLKLTSDTQIIGWPRKADEFRRDTAFDLAPDVFAYWTGIPRSSPNFQKAYDGEKKQFAVYLALLRPMADGKWTAPQPPRAADVTKGVPVRLAQQGRLLICWEQTCPAEIDASGMKNDKVVQSDQVVLQMGQMYIVPLTGGTFRSQSGIIALDTNGLPTQIQVIEKVAAAEAATAGAKDVATQFAALPADIRAAELAKIKAKTDELNAKQTLATARANLSVADQTSSLAAQTALIKAQTDLATAQINAGLPVQTAALTAQTSLISAQSVLATAQASAQSALINAQVALATAQANAAVIDKTSVLAAQATLISAQAALINAAAALAKAQIATP